MAVWSDSMLDEIARLGENFKCLPVIAHVDRYMNYLQDQTLMDRVRQRGLWVQVNASYFLEARTAENAIRHLRSGDIQLIGSDCHNLDSRAPNLGAARRQARGRGAETAFQALHRNAEKLLQWKGV